MEELHLPEEIRQKMSQMVEKLLSEETDDLHYEPHCVVDKEWEDRFDKISEEADKIKNQMEKVVTQRKLFWIELREHAGVIGKSSIRFENSTVYVGKEVEETESEDVPE